MRERCELRLCSGEENQQVDSRTSRDSMQVFFDIFCSSPQRNSQPSMYASSGQSFLPCEPWTARRKQKKPARCYMYHVPCAMYQVPCAMYQQKILPSPHFSRGPHCLHARPLSLFSILQSLCWLFGAIECQSSYKVSLQSDISVTADKL
jgi:hypothetical protein